MIRNAKKFYLYSALALCGASLTAFLIFFIPNYVVMRDLGYFEYVVLFLEKLFSFLIPPIAATLILLASFETARKTTLLRTLLLALTRTVYLFPYYYLYYTAYGNDWIEALTLSSLVTLLGIAVLFLHILLLVTVMRYAARLPLVKKMKKELPPKQMDTITKKAKNEFNKKADSELSLRITEKGIFDFTVPMSLGVFAGVFTEFVIKLISEMIDTAIYLIEYAGYYRINEIIYIGISYLFLLGELLLTHALCYLFKQFFTYEKGM